jgi:hypothetical protein
MEEKDYNITMDFEKTIYGILSEFEKQLDADSFDMELFKPEKWGISQRRLTFYLRMLLNAGYIEGIKISPMANGSFVINVISPAITLKGLEYLAENSMGKKLINLLKKGAEISLNSL